MVYDCCYSIEEDFCTIGYPCEVDNGDCDSHEECQDNLVCGLNNCPESLGYDPTVDCCYDAIVGDEDFCTTDNPCGADEGDCDSTNECHTKLKCDTDNECTQSLEFASGVDCCVSTCKSHVLR